MTETAPTALRVFGVVSDSIVDGPGLRLCVFTQGCPHGCAGCHNPESHDPDSGYDEPIEAIVGRYTRNPLLSGVTLSGGEPLLQAEACLALLGTLPEGTNIWLYTGYTWEAMLDHGTEAQQILIRMCDVVVDGPFVQAQRSLELKFCGSGNQRLIDVKKSLAAEGIVRWEAPVW